MHEGPGVAHAAYNTRKAEAEDEDKKSEAAGGERTPPAELSTAQAAWLQSAVSGQKKPLDLPSLSVDAVIAEIAKHLHEAPFARKFDMFSRRP